VRLSEWIIVSYLIYVLLVAWGRPLSTWRRLIVTLVSLADVVLVWRLSFQDAGIGVLARDWLPAGQILVAYWLSGAFFERPMPGVEAWLAAGDRWLFDRLGARWIPDRGPRWVLEVLELGYLVVYAVIPAGFAAAWFLAPSFDVDRFWTVVLLSEFVCYVMAPWIQTRTPRAVGDHAAVLRRPVAVRRLNSFIVRTGSIQVNTFPSAHAAGAVATALVVWEVLPVAGLVFAVLAIGVAAGSVIGRYHYAADALTGAALATLIGLL
jgi:hypothetical protein